MTTCICNLGSRITRGVVGFFMAGIMGRWGQTKTVLVNKFFVAVLSFGLVGCMGTVHRSGTTVYPPRSHDHEIIVVESDSQLPKPGQWIKIGEATVTDNGWGADVSKMLVEKARDLGGDALVGVQKYKSTQTLGIGWKDFARGEVWRRQ